MTGRGMPRSSPLASIFFGFFPFVIFSWRDYSIEMKLHIWIELNCTRSISLAALFLEIIKKWIESKCILIGYEQHLGCSKGVKSKGLKLNRSNVVHIQIVCTCSRFKTYILYSLIQNIWPKVVYRWFVCRWFWPASHQMLLRTWHETTSTTMTLQ